MRSLTIALVLLALGASAPAAGAATQTAQSGQVSASFSFRGHFPRYSGERLKISQGGVVLYDQAVVSSFCGTQCAPGSASVSRPSVHVIDLEHTGQPDVVLDLFSGGAHCCTVLQIFSYDAATRGYVEAERNFGDPGVRFLDLRHNGRVELLTADDSFAYEFTSFAASGLPIAIFRFSRGRFIDVTRRYPKLIARDAAVWLSAFKSMAPRYQATTGVIAAWAADEDLLGHAKLVATYLSAQARAGHLNSGGSGGVWPSGKRFVTKLERFLRAHGYRR